MNTLIFMWKASSNDMVHYHLMLKGNANFSTVPTKGWCNLQTINHFKCNLNRTATIWYHENGITKLYGHRLISLYEETFLGIIFLITEMPKPYFSNIYSLATCLISKFRFWEIHLIDISKNNWWLTHVHIVSRLPSSS